MKINTLYLNDIENTTDYPVDLIVKHMSRIDLPDYLLLAWKENLDSSISIPDKKIAVHLHVFM